MQKILIHILLVSCFVGCQHGKIGKKKRNDYLQESIARLSDIPDAPLHVAVQKVVKSEHIPDNLQVFYKFQSVSRESVKKFYMDEMERLGWQLHFDVDGEQDFVEFTKPNGMICLMVLKDSSFIITLIRKKEMP